MSNGWSDLAEDETVAYRARLHWIVLILPLPILVYLLFGAPGIMFLVLGLSGLKDPNFHAPSFILAGIVDMCLTTIVVIAVVMRMKSAKFLVTNKRVILKSGIMKRRAAEVPLEEILRVNVYQDGFDRLFNQGIMTITTASRGTAVQFSHVSNPVEFRKQVQEQVVRIGANGNTLAQLDVIGQPGRIATMQTVILPRKFMSLFTPVATNYISVHDLAAATSWYAEKFGLRPRAMQFDGGQNGVELVLSDEIFFVLGPGGANPDETPMLYASRIEKARDFLIAHGVTVTDVQQDRQGTRFFELRDLEGNVIEICEDH